MSRLCAVVLAAGSSERFGSNKQAATLAGETLLGRTLNAVCGVLRDCDVYLVLAENAPALDLAEQSALHVVRNALAWTGMASSIRAGVTALPSDAEAVILLLADQPLIDRTDLDRLIACWRRSPGACVAAAYCGTVGVPAIFPRAMFAALLELQGDRGARSLLTGKAGVSIFTVSMPHAAFDVDTPADLEALQRGLS
jgi:molybdenum cofactor cytidylyltransferase